MHTMHIKYMRDLRAIRAQSVRGLGVATSRNWFMLRPHHYEIKWVQLTAMFTVNIFLSSMLDQLILVFLILAPHWSFVTSLQSMCAGLL